MAVTVNVRMDSSDFVPQQKCSLRHVIADVTFDSSYPTGGEQVRMEEELGCPSGATHVSSFAVLHDGMAAGFLAAEYDDANEKIILYDEAGAQVSNATDASTVTVHLQLWYTV